MSGETIIALGRFKFYVNDEYSVLYDDLKELRREHDEKVELLQKQTRLTALCLMEVAKKNVVQGYDKFINDCDGDENKRDFRISLLDEQYNVAMRMRSLFMQCIDFPKPKKPKKATS